MVDWNKCVGCDVCVQKCPAKAPNLFDEGLEPTKAIYIPFPQAVPKRAAIQVDYCRYFQTGKCKVCERVCPADAIDFEQKDEIVQKFKAFDAKVVFGAEDFCWPDQSLEEKYPKVEQGYRDE